MLGRADRSLCTKPVETAGSGKPILAGAPRVRANGRDPIRAKGIMASGACDSRIKGRTHGRTNQQSAQRQKPLANGGPSTQGQRDRTSGAKGKSVSYRVEPGGPSITKKK